MTAETKMKARVGSLLGKTGYSGGGSAMDTTRPTSGPVQTPKPLERAAGGSIPGDDRQRPTRGAGPGKSTPDPKMTQDDLDNLTAARSESRRQDALDAAGRARGGKSGSRGHGKKGHTNVNVIVAPPHPPGPPGGMMPPPGMAPHPPMPPPGAGGPPGAGLPPGLPPGGPGLPPGAAGPGGPPGAPMMKPPGMKTGGLVKAGSGSAEGRKDKIKAYGGR